MLGLFRDKSAFVPAAQALKGRAQSVPTATTHAVTGQPLVRDLPEGLEEAVFGMGCFWGVERMFWRLPGIVSTMVGYSGGTTPNPTYDEVCSGLTNHNEVVRVVFDPNLVAYEDLLKVFWEGHDPTQGMRQGNDRGTQYRSGVYTFSDAQRAAAERTRAAYQQRLTAAGYGPITTEVVPAGPFYMAEDYHQQYLHKNPRGYCGVGGTGVTCPIGVAA